MLFYKIVKNIKNNQINIQFSKKNEHFYPLSHSKKNRRIYDGQTRQQNIIGVRSDALFR